MFKSVVVDQAHTLARRPPSAGAVGRHHHLRGACQRPDATARGRAEGIARHLSRARRAGDDRAPAQARRHRDRAPADPFIRRRTSSAGARPEELLGLQHAELLRARAALCRRQHPERVPLHRRRAAQRRHRGDPRRGLQPHRRRQSSRPDAVLSRHRQLRLLLARSRHAALLRELHRHRQRAEARASARAADGDGFAALLGRGVPRRRLPLRSGQHARPHAGVRSAFAHSSPRSGRTRCSPTSR